MKVYQILNWQRSFENERSRAVDRCNFVWMPNKMGLGLSRLLAHEGGHALFGRFVLIAEACSRQRKPRNGYLTDDGRPDGRAWDAEDIAVMIRCSTQEATDTLSVLSRPKIGWVAEIDVEEAIAGEASSEDRAEVNEPTTPESELKTPRKTQPPSNPRPTPVDPPPDPLSMYVQNGEKEPPPGAEAGGGAEGVPLDVGRGEFVTSRPAAPSRHPAYVACVNDFGLAASLGPKNRDKLSAMLFAFGEAIVRDGLTEARANAATNPIPYADTICNRLYAEKFQGRRKKPGAATEPETFVVNDPTPEEAARMLTGDA